MEDHLIMWQNVIMLRHVMQPQELKSNHKVLDSESPETLPAEAHSLCESASERKQQSVSSFFHLSIHPFFHLSIHLFILPLTDFQGCFLPSLIWPVTQRSAVMPRVVTQNRKFTANWSNTFQDEESRTHTAPNVTPTLSYPKVSDLKQNHRVHFKLLFS